MQEGTTSVGFRKYIEVFPGTLAETLPKRRNFAVCYEVSLLGYVKKVEEI